jgi:flagellar basal body rod protein FlgC
MSSIDELAPTSSSLKADDLDGDEVSLTIASYVVKEFDETDNKTGETYKRKKPIFSFEETEKTFVCNVTNARALAAAFGSREMDDWVGKKITLFPTVTSFGDKTVPCIRVRVLKEKGGKPKFLKPSENPAEGLDDEIPF